MKANDRKQKITDKAKRLNCRQMISELTVSSTGLWRLVNWGKGKRNNEKNPGTAAAAEGKTSRHRC